MTATTTTHRGTSNTNERGSSYARRARRDWMMTNFREADGTVRCYRPECRLPLVNTGDWRTTANYMTVDRIIPGIDGGTYRRNNIRPACMHCNAETGQAIGVARRTQMTTVAV